MGTAVLEELRQKIRDIPDFPQKGIVFKDITPLLNDPRTFKLAIDAMAHQYVGRHVDLVVGIEARGFIIGSALAYLLNAGLIPLRKPGKLPFIVDDLLSTGGTMRASVDLVKTLEADIVGVSFLVELGFLEGRKRLQGCDVSSLIIY